MNSIFIAACHRLAPSFQHLKDQTIGVTHRAIAVACVVTLTLMACQERANDTPQSAQNFRDEERRMAAFRGTEWLIDHAEKMPPGWAYPNLSRLSRLTTSEEHHDRIREMLELDRREGQHSAIPDDLTDPALLRQKRFVPILSEVLRRREIGLAWKNEADALHNLIAAHEVDLWETTNLRNKPTVLHALASLGIKTSMTEGRLLDELREMAVSETAQNLAGSTRYIYALTHIIFTRSHYFRNPVDLEGLEFMVPIFLTALARHSQTQMGVMEIDMVGEVLASLELLGVSEPRMEVARRRLVAAQNPDGSWGTGRGVTPKRIHPTFNAVAGLINFHSAFE
ncbi:hypothetical protein MK280_08160 [Myxococcota bacterium]|nr:hypothetical protein [Myxococcota bacterium]